MGNEILELVTECLTENRRCLILNSDKDYQMSKLRERMAYDKLKETLNEQQKELLDNFTTAASEKGGNKERIFYQQGMRDLYALLMSLA